MKTKTIILNNDTVEVNGQIYKRVEKIVKPQKKKTGWERAYFNDDYCCIDSGEDDGYSQFMEEYEDADDMVYSNGNYFTNDELAKNISRAMHLWLRISRWQAENDKPIAKKDWADDEIKYSIIYNCKQAYLFVGSYCCIRAPLQVYFSSEEKAIKAMEIFRDELMWYFAEFKSRMDAEG